MTVTIFQYSLILNCPDMTIVIYFNSCLMKIIKNGFNFKIFLNVLSEGSNIRKKQVNVTDFRSIL